jgi:hypothetical protein
MKHGIRIITIQYPQVVSVSIHSSSPPGPLLTEHSPKKETVGGQVRVWSETADHATGKRRTDGPLAETEVVGTNTKERYEWLALFLLFGVQ